MYIVIKLRYDPAADAIYIYLGKKRRLTCTKGMHNAHSMRMLDYDTENSPIGIEVLGTTRGIDVEGLPKQAELAALLQAYGFKVLAAH